MPSSNIDGNEKEKSAVVYDSNSSKPNLKGDWLNFFLLLLLYTMQGFPLGLTSAIPILLQSQNDVSYQDQVNCYNKIQIIEGIILDLLLVPRNHKSILYYIIISFKYCIFFQALFSLAAWPFSLKLLWAPLVDALYIQRIGRRKSWLIPVQYLMGNTFNFLHNAFPINEYNSIDRSIYIKV